MAKAKSNSTSSSLPKAPSVGKTDDSGAKDKDAPNLLEVADLDTAPALANKQKMEFDGALSRQEVAAQLEALARGIEQGQVRLQAKDQSLQLSPSHHFELELKASRKGNKERLSFDIAWRINQDQKLEVIVSDKEG